MEVRLNLEEEIRNDYVITKDMKKVWNVQLDLVNKVMEVCDKYNLKVFADSGTLLGIVRHNGFIPWDDDIDLAMLREDYNKLIEVGEKEFKGKYFFQTEETDPGSHRGHIQIRNSNTTAILNFEKNKNYLFNQGIFIDIFPLDFVPNNKISRMIFSKIVSYKKNMSFRFRELTIYYEYKKGLKGLKRLLLHKILNPISKKYGNIFYKNFDKFVQKYKDKKNCSYVANISLIPLRKRGFYKKEYYNYSIMKKFENIELPVPNEYEKVLDELYGDWKIPKNCNSTHGDVFFDTKKSYKNYINKKNNNEEKNEKI